MAAQARMVRLHDQLQPTVAHLAATSSPPSSAMVARDMYGNQWQLGYDGTTTELSVLAAADRTGQRALQDVALPAELKSAHAPVAAGTVIIATDDNGYLWATRLGTQLLFRLCPRGPGYTMEGVVGVLAKQHRYSPSKGGHLLWQQFDPSALPAGSTITALTSSLQGYCAIVTLSDGAGLRHEIAIAKDGESVMSPEPPTTDGPRWRAIPARLECGDHDITAAEVGGKVFVSGGASR